MSRTVPLDRALDDADRRYLRGLGAHGSHLEKRIDSSFPPSKARMAEFELEERKRHSEINGSGLNNDDQNLLLLENERLRAELEALRSLQDSPPPADVPSYVGWSKAQLEAEIDRVNAEDPDAKLEKGKVAEMTFALTAYFAAE